MRATIIVSLATLLLVACSQAPSISGNPSDSLLVSYSSGGGFTGEVTRLEIGRDGVAIAWSTMPGRPRGPVASRRLSATELGELKTLLEPFPSYERQYGRVVADGLATSITVESGDLKKTVDVYSSADAQPPSGWTELTAKIQEILGSLRTGG